MHIAASQHENVLNVLGLSQHVAGDGSVEHYIVLPYMPAGNLMKWIHSFSKGMGKCDPADVYRSKVSLSTRLTMCLQLANVVSVSLLVLHSSSITRKESACIVFFFFMVSLCSAGISSQAQDPSSRPQV